jgi:hypothetical protein
MVFNSVRTAVSSAVQNSPELFFCPISEETVARWNVSYVQRLLLVPSEGEMCKGERKNEKVS